MKEIEEIKSRYIRGEATEREAKILLEWLEKNPEERTAYYQEKDIWDSYAFVNNSQNYSSEEELLKLKRRIRFNPKKSFSMPGPLKVAALLLLAFLSGWLVQFLIANQGTSDVVAEMREVVVPNGQIHQLFLADGSRIWLNSGSKIDVPSFFTGNDRKVSLEGEAFFEIAKDPEHPFKVEVKGQTIEVLGTSFNVRAYPDADVVQTTLHTGKIKLHTSREVLNLLPGEQTNVHINTGKIQVKNVNPVNYYSWRDGRYELKDECLTDVFRLVERWYDVSITYDENDFKDMRFSVVLKRNKSVEHFLALLNLSIPIQYQKNMDEIIIEKK
ncbi:FecR family protein [Sunxiuqinia elliptica]|uniref:FecR family protein n=1 Tax=Sunxiuqinia elliptica TaxID=655355 RepID=A0A4R6H658_9BACT|nr:FecR domain-containing protein [Sunxiuqinia elliptica]TDO03434.1 FecR family protein [Sunxiuqinia elliptica]TDO59630.1 FecR family protein [Sunxiuqinia elliptica]